MYNMPLICTGQYELSQVFTLLLHIPYRRYAYVSNFEMAIVLCHILGMNTKGHKSSYYDNSYL